MTRPDWLDEPRIQAAITATVADAPPISDATLDLLHRNGFFAPATAMTSSSHGPAAVVEGEAIGAAGTPSTGVRRSGGEARSLSPAAPTSRRKPVAATTGSHEHAG